ncbi:PREDICTED: uncharacterized protein LOC106789916 [Polistes canadensis]|uniref:uncharacterized protein LOC106789916 n=1 Tax=Polistes canadensis TaxID=91411 RepID=UPI000718B669|nr:PREDICTED: uncharacterized protein LOC106789916 [Polistes canadensis]
MDIFDLPYYRIKHLLIKIKDEWKLWKTKEEITIMEKYAKEGRLYTIGYISKILCSSYVAELLGKSTEVLKFAAFTLAQLFHVYCISFVGQRIIDHSSDICFKAYSGLWYDAPMVVRKMILLIIRRSLKPSYLTAGKIFVFCLETFSTVRI